MHAASILRSLLVLSSLMALVGCAAEGEATDAESDALAKGAGVALRFDVVTLDCGKGQTACTKDSDKCLCESEWSALNYGSSAHYVAMPTSSHRDEIAAKGNALAGYVDDLNGGFKSGLGGAAAAKAMIASATSANGGNLPQWVIVNEISKSMWTDGDRSYRKYVVDVVRTLNEAGKNTIVCSPFSLPNQYTDKADWSDIAKYGWIAAEVQLTGKEVQASGFSVTASRKIYQDAITSYGNVKVPKSRLMLLDNFAGTTNADGFGRQGITIESWQRAVGVRADAVTTLGVAGYVSYGWAGNKMHTTSASRIDIVDAYAKRSLP